MKGITKLAILGTAAVMLSGCGGSHNDLRLPSLYAGKWTGTWTGPETKDGGALTFTIASDGSLDGTMARKGGISGNMTGVVNDTGHMTAAVSFPTGGNFTVDGQMTFATPNLNGAFVYKWLGTQYTGTFTMTGA